MYFYLYDSFVLDKKFESLLTKIEHRLIELGINGQIGKLSVLKNMDQMIQDAIKKDAETIIIVGDDKTFSRAIKILAKEKVTIGFVPFNSKSRYAKALGIPNTEEAVNILSRRMVEKIDIGKINNSIYFLTSVEMDTTGQKVIIDCNKKFQITPDPTIKHVSFCNFGNIIDAKELHKGLPSNPKDGSLEIIFYDQGSIIRRGSGKDSIIPAKKIRVETEGEQMPLQVDGETVTKTPAIIETSPLKIKLIVGKKRMF